MVRLRKQKPRIPRKLKKAGRHLIRIIPPQTINGYRYIPGADNISIVMNCTDYCTINGYPQTKWVRLAILGLIREEKKIFNKMSVEWKKSMIDNERLFEDRLLFGFDPAVPGTDKTSLIKLSI